MPTRSLRSSSSLSICVLSRKTAMARSKSFSSVASDIWNKLPCMSSFIYLRSSCFQEETQASPFFECFPRYFLSIHRHHALWCHHIHECKSHHMHLAAQLTRSSWAPTISLDSHQNIRLHTGARVNAVLLIYLLTHVAPSGKWCCECYCNLRHHSWFSFLVVPDLLCS